MAHPSLAHYREEALRRLQTGREHEFLALCLPYLEQCPADWHFRLVAARTYLALGLVQPARDLLDEGSALGDAPAEVGSIRDSLGTLDRPPLPWTPFTGVFERNLASLSHAADGRALRETWSARCEAYQVFKDAHGQFQLRERGFDRRWRWLPIIADHEQSDTIRALPDGISRQMPDPYLFEGVGMGGYFERIYKATCDTFLGFSCALFIVEGQPARFAAMLHLKDWSMILSDPRVHVFLGSDWAKRLRIALENDWDLPIPRQVITVGTAPASETRAIDVLHDVATSREAQIVESTETLERQYDSRTIDHWAGRFDDALNGKGEPLRILAGVSRHTTFLQHSMRDIRRSLESLGHQCQVITEKNDYAMVGLLSYHEAIRRFDPDFFLAIDHLRTEFGAVIPRNLPILTWDQDALPQMMTRQNLTGMAPHDFLATCNKIPCVDLGVNARQCIAARVPTCSEQFDGEPLSDAERARYDCDASYVSHASQTPHEFHLQERGNYPQPELQRLLDTIYELLPRMLAQHVVANGHITQKVLDKASQQCGLPITDERLASRLKGWYIWRLADRIFRHEGLEWVAGWARSRNRTFRIYGNGWERHPTLSEFAAGPAGNGRELLCVYRASKINVQLMPAGFIHQRALDGLAAGGFFLTRLVPHDLQGRLLKRLHRMIVERGIRSDVELVGSTDADLRNLLTEYLGHPPEENARRELYSQLCINSELSYPDEVFDDFCDITFDSADRFAILADAYVEDGPQQAAIADRMRRVVIEKFSYRSAVQGFLRSMAEYLSENRRSADINSRAQDSQSTLA